MPEEHNHGGSEHWEHVDIPDHYEVVIHGDHVHLGQFEPAHISYYRQGEVLGCLYAEDWPNHLSFS